MSIEMQLIAIANFKSVLHKNYLSNLYNFYISLLTFVFHYVVSFLYFFFDKATCPLPFQPFYWSVLEVSVE